MKTINLKTAIACIGTAIVCAGCSATTGGGTTVNNSRGSATIYNDLRETGPVAGVGIESQDINSMTDQMMRDMLSNATLAGRTPAARIVIDEKYFRNESSSRLNKKIITDRLRVSLNNGAQGRMIFVGRHFSNMIEAERGLKRDGMVDGGTIRKTEATAGADYRLGGNITSLDSVSTASGLTSRTHQIIFEMVDLELGTIVWSGIYDFKKTAQDDVLYR